MRIKTNEQRFPKQVVINLHLLEKVATFVIPPTFKPRCIHFSSIRIFVRLFVTFRHVCGRYQSFW